MRPFTSSGCRWRRQNYPRPLFSPEHFDEELVSGHLFLFFNRKQDCVKILTWDRDGLAIWYKRLEAGSFQLSALSDGSEAMEIDATQLSLLLAGIDMASARRRKRYKAA